MMKTAINGAAQKRRGRPPTGRDPHVTSRMSQSLIGQVERWAGANNIGRSEAIRRLVELGLTIRKTAAPLSASRAARARELATTAIEKMTDAAAPPEERASRRRRLTKGPSEFREHRVDMPKASK